MTGKQSNSNNNNVREEKTSLVAAVVVEGGMNDHALEESQFISVVTKPNHHSSSACNKSKAMLVLWTVILGATFVVCRLLLVSTFADGSTAIIGRPSVASVCTQQETLEHPVLCHMLHRAEHDLDALVQDMQDHAAEHGLLVGQHWTQSDLLLPVETSQQRRRLHADKKQLPVVFAHGMGDSCFNSGMQHITQRASNLLGGVYATCIATGKTQAEDTKNGYFLNMDASVDVFAAAVAADPHLQDGFHAIGFSQGNNVIRGYIARYNTPAVHTFLSVNGVNAGEGAVPYCRPSAAKTKDASLAFDMCDYLMEQASRSAYTEFAQEHSFQATYWRDARPAAWERYQQYSQLAKWNNEAGFINQTLVENWSKTQGFVWIMAQDDGMVWPKEGEHWGAPDPNDPFHHILPMEETEWYKKDLFGLRTAQEANKNFFESFPGDHLRFTMEDFDKWIQTYLLEN